MEASRTASPAAADAYPRSWCDGLSLLGFLVYPTAPPRLAGIGIVDTVSNGHVDLNRGLVSSVYNPYAAVPSMHIGYALIVAASLIRDNRESPCASSARYTHSLCYVVVATGNHFLLALAGPVVVGVAAGVARCLRDRPRTPPASLASLNGESLREPCWQTAIDCSVKGDRDK